MKIKNSIKENFAFIFLGIIFLLFGIYLSIFRNHIHFYTPFAIGMLILLVIIYNSISEEKLFNNWAFKDYLFFSIVLLFLCILIDKIGIYLGYWTYQFSTFFDEILKYIFEWAIPLVYFMVVIIIGLFIFRKFTFGLALVLSLLFFVTPLGLFTEYINHFSYSWIILKMPFSDLKIGNFFVVFQTLGYWSMALITFTLYKISEKLK